MELRCRVAGRRIVSVVSGPLLCCGLAALGCGDQASGGDSESGAGESDSTDDSDSSSEDSGSTGPSEPPWGDPFDPCEDVTCSGHGICVANSGLPTCVCDPGFLAKRYECITCSPLAEDHVYNADVSMVTVQPSVTVAGAAPLPDNYAYIYLVSGPDRMRVVRIPDDAAPLHLLPGVYDVQFDHDIPTYPDYGDDLPVNQDMILAAGLVIDTDSELLIDIPVVTVTASLTVGGEPRAAWYTHAHFAATEDVLDFESLDDAVNIVDLIPGVYDLWFSGGGNSHALTASQVFIGKSGHIDVDVDMIRQNGALSVGGQLGSGDPADQHETDVFLLDPIRGRVGIGNPSYDNQYDIELIPGAYAVVYESSGQPTLGLPDNEHAVLPELTITSDDATTNIDIPFVTRTGALTLNGVPVAADQWGSELFYINRTTGDRVLIRDLAWGEYSIEVIPGVYDILYDRHEDRAGMPANREALIATGVVVDESGTFDIDVPMITVTGSITINGQVAVEPDAGFIYFVQPEIGQTVVADVSLGSYSVDIVPGTYDIVYDVEGPYWENPASLPATRNATLASQVVLGDSGTLDIDVPAIEVTGSLTIEGEATPGGRLWLNGPGNARTMVGLSGAPFATWVVPGTYEVSYGRDSMDLPVPQNSRAILDCIVIE